jgi:hypothetical protein
MWQQRWLLKGTQRISGDREGFRDKNYIVTLDTMT